MSKKEQFKNWCKEHEGLVVGVSVAGAAITGVIIGKNCRTYSVKDINTQVGTVQGIPVYLATPSQMDKVAAVNTAMQDLNIDPRSAGILKAVPNGGLSLESVKNDLILHGYDPTSIGICLLGKKAE